MKIFPKSFLYAMLLSAMIFSLSACKFQKLTKSPDWKVRYEGAMEYYNKRDYYRASLLLEDLVPLIKGTEAAENIQFYFAYAQYNQQQYLLAAHYFRSFFDSYRYSARAEEAFYMHAFSLYLDAPYHYLDQESAHGAIDAMQDFLNLYPKSQFAERANKVLFELRERQEQKSFDNAMLYYDLGRHKAAVIAFENFQKDFPDAKNKEKAVFLQAKAQLLYAQNSIFSVQKERFDKTIEICQLFLDKNSAGKFTKDVEEIYADALDGLKKLEKIEKDLQNNNEKQ
jgi:outer membrane protein assembly factor BamD